MIPSWKQWKGWKLPSKYTAIGMYIGIFGLLVGIIPLVFMVKERYFDQKSDKEELVILAFPRLKKKEEIHDWTKEDIEKGLLPEQLLKLAETLLPEGATLEKVGTRDGIDSFFLFQNSEHLDETIIYRKSKPEH